MKITDPRIITGHEAIAYAEEHGGLLRKYADPIDGALDDLTPDQARQVAREDPSLIYTFAADACTEPLTLPMVHALRTEASANSDFVTYHICGVVIGDEDPVTTAEAWEDRYGGGGFRRVEQAAIMAVDSREAARRRVADVINEARGMDDSRPFVRVVADA